MKFKMRCKEIKERWEADRVWYTATFSPFTRDETTCGELTLTSSTPFRSYSPGGLYDFDIKITEA